MNITIKKAENGVILRSFLTETLRLSHRTLAALKRKEGGILLNGAPVTVRAVLREGDVLSLDLADTEEEKSESIAPVNIPVEILYEDEYITLCNKPSGMPTHPSFRHRDDTLANALAYRYRGTPFVFRAVNRLDRETSGVVLTARNAFAAAYLGAALARGDIQKEYLAVVKGEIKRAGEVHSPIRRKSESIILREVCAEGEAGAESAHTLFSPVCAGEECSLILVRTLTGRTHQIRVHMSSIGHALLGDGLYGEATGLDRTALHAYRLAFPHPKTNEVISITAPLPPDLVSFLKENGLNFGDL